MNIQKALAELKTAYGLSDYKITEHVSKSYPITQPTIQRLRTGRHRSTNYEVGKAIEELLTAKRLTANQ